MLVSLRAALLGATAVALHVATVDRTYAQQPTGGQSTLPPVIVTPTDTPAAAKPRGKQPSASGDVVLPSTGPSNGEPSAGLSTPLATTVVGRSEIEDQRVSSNDVASLARNAPGVSFYQGGGVSSLPVINGLADDRILIMHAGMQIVSACANHMNPPLSYLDPSQVGSIEIVSGVGPVSKGGDSIAGSILVEPSAPRYASLGEGLRTSGSISTFYRSNGNGVGTSASAEVATHNFSVRYDGGWSRAGDYTRGGGGAKVRSTEYEAGNHSLTLNARNGTEKVTVQFGMQVIPYQAFVNQRMDMVDNHAYFANARYQNSYAWGTLDARIYFQKTSHEMNFLEDKLPANMPMRTEQTDFGYALKAEIPVTGASLIRVGNELRGQLLDDWWPAIPGSMMMGPNDYKNISDGKRIRVGTFAEWENKWSRAWTTLIGVRNDVVWMDAGKAQPYSSMGMCTNPAQCDATAAAAFNARGHARTDINFDATALVRYEPSSTATFETGYARKTRSPNLYERYAWGTGGMSSSMIGWFGDANGYVGNLDLKPEVAHRASITAGWHDAARKQWELKVTPYYSYVENFIDVDRIGTFTDSMGDTFAQLKFANHDARLYGVNVSGRTKLHASREVGEFAVWGVIGYVNGERIDGGALYHMMPLNAKVGLTHRLGGWSNGIELVAVDTKDRVDTNRNEFRTPGYALVNVRTAYEWRNVRLDLGVDNLFDKLYYAPLAGADWADYNVVGGRIGPVPAVGRSYNAGLTVRF